MKRINILDKTFEKTISKEEIQKAVQNVADRITADYADKNPILVVVLNGAFVFGADLFSMLKFPCQISFTKLKSYSGTSSSGTIVEQLPVTEEVTGRHVIIVEDIIETGYSMQYLIERLRQYHPASIEIAAFSFKPDRLMVPDVEPKIKYIGMTLPEAFIVGYGLDYNQEGRNLRSIYSLVKD